jgi:signal transduction histidine kinase
MAEPTGEDDGPEPDGETLRRRLAFYELVAAISTRFIDLPAEQIRPAIRTSLREVGEFFGVDRGSVMVLPALARAPEGEPLRTPNELLRMAIDWRAPGVPAAFDEDGQLRVAHETPDETEQANRWFRDMIVHRRTMQCDSLEQLPAELGWLRRRWTVQGVKSRLSVPVILEGACVGLLAIDTVYAERAWQPETRELLEAVGPTFGHAVLRKQHTDELREAHDALERKVQERTRELRDKQAQLVQSEKLASLGQLVAGIAHEMNTPLGAIKANDDTLRRSLQRVREILADPAMPAEVREHPRLWKLLDNARKLGQVSVQPIERIDTIVRSLRSFARLDRAEHDTIDLNAALQDALVLLGSHLQGRVEVELDLEAHNRVRCASADVNQVLMNVLLNAAQAIGQAGTVHIRSIDEDGGVRITIRDDGAGIEQAHLGRVFDPGFTTKGVGVGTGLGLTIAHQVMEEHSGRITVQSQPGEGTTVTLWLPGGAA